MASAQTRRDTSDAPGVGRLDADAFAAQFEAVGRTLWVIAAGIVNDRNMAEDMVQEAALVGYRKLDQFEPGSNFVAWMGRIVRNISLNQNRKAASKREAACDPAAMPGEQAASDRPVLRLAGDFSLPAMQQVLDDRLVDALNQIGEIARACLLLRTVEGLDYQTIGRVLDIPEGTAMSHVHRARIALRRILMA
jgi:RNA polymerase sigma-70 factor (ECF subfamily)